ncbi:MAG: hypothetical protein ACTSPP_12015 [Candidatus Heimdallarchaeaceae archaeon]
MFLRKDAVEVWSLDERLIKYQQIFKKRILPRYILAKNFKVGFDVNNSITELLELHNEKGEEFRLFVSVSYLNFTTKKVKNLDSLFLKTKKKLQKSSIALIKTNK